MAEWRVCPRCGHTKAGICSPCFPEAAEREHRLELAEWQRQEEQEARRASGQLFCPDHGQYDECWEFRRPEPEPRRLTWQEAMAELRKRYVPPG